MCMVLKKISLCGSVSHGGFLICNFETVCWQSKYYCYALQGSECLWPFRAVRGTLSSNGVQLTALENVAVHIPEESSPDPVQYQVSVAGCRSGCTGLPLATAVMTWKSGSLRRESSFDRASSMKPLIGGEHGRVRVKTQMQSLRTLATSFSVFFALHNRLEPRWCARGSQYNFTGVNVLSGSLEI